MDEPSKFSDLRVKHLDMLQAVIGRMSNHSATLKNYCITLTTAVCGIAVTWKQPRAALIALFAVTIFALLDAQYLRLERRFRDEFENVRKQDWGTRPDFAINGKGPFWWPYLCALINWSIVLFYVPLAIIACAVVYIAGKL
jgi:hypothetical protein